MADDLTLARQAKVVSDHAANRVASQVSALYRHMVGELITEEAVDEFIRQALPIIRRGVMEGGQMAGSLFRQTRRAAGIKGSPPAAPRVEFNAEQATSSLRFLGLVEPAREAGALMTVPFIPVDPNGVAEKVGAGAGRRVIKSGMDAMVRHVKSDKKALGYARVTQGADACHFCSMLESRGAVFTKASFRDSDSRFKDNAMPPVVLNGEMVAKVHDRCRCILVPIWSKSSTIQKNADRLYEVWKQVQRDYRWLARRTGADMQMIWRWYWEGRIDDIALKYAV